MPPYRKDTFLLEHELRGRDLQQRAESAVALAAAFGDGIESVTDEVEQHAAHILRHNLDRFEIAVEVELPGDLEILVLRSGAVIGEVQTLLDECVQVGRLPVAAAVARVLQHRAISGLDPQSFCLGIAGLNEWFLGYPDQALQAALQAVAVARSQGYPQSVDQALHGVAHTHLLRREPDAALSYIDLALAVSREHGFSQRIALLS